MHQFMSSHSGCSTAYYLRSGSNPVNYEVLTAIGSGAISLQEVGINHIDYEMCNNLDDGDLILSVMLCMQVCLAAVKKVAKATMRSHFDRESKMSKRTGTNATLSELGRLMSTLETIDTLFSCHSNGSFSDEGDAVSKTAPRLYYADTMIDGQSSTGSFSTGGSTISETALRWCFGRWLVHDQLQHRG